MAIGIMLSVSRHAARVRDSGDTASDELEILPENVRSENPAMLVREEKKTERPGAGTIYEPKISTMKENNNTTASCPLRFLISGGGTGGHIFRLSRLPGALRRRHPDCEILFCRCRRTHGNGTRTGRRL